MFIPSKKTWRGFQSQLAGNHKDATMNQSNESDPLSLRDIYLRALDRKTPESREAFLDGACGDNLSLHNKVEALLRENAEDSFLESPAIAENETIMDSVLESPGTMVGRYKVLQRIGEGGMGAVYMAEQTEPVSRKVALKIIKQGMDTKQVVARFEAERQALAMMDHPNIAKVLDAGATDNGRPFFVMELVRGVPITEYCDKNKLTTKERLELFIPVCQAIQHAHQKGIIHRDVKPSNVMVTLHDGNPVPKVIDFGIAKATNQKLTEKTLFTNYSQMIGTPAYMSPEQAEMSGLDVDTRTDVYSLGVLLYELLTGTTPFPSKELLSMGYGEMQRVISETEPPKPSTRMSTMQHEELTVTATRRGIDVSVLQKQFKGDLDWIVMKSLEKDRTHRYETVAELAADVNRHLNNETVNAAAPALSYQIQKLYQRQKKFIRVAAIVFLVLLLGIAGTTWQMVRAKRATERVQNESVKTREVADLLDGLVRNLLPELRYRQNNQAAVTILDILDDMASHSLTNNPAAELVTRYNLMQGYMAARERGEKLAKQVQQGKELARRVSAFSQEMPITESIFELHERNGFGKIGAGMNWQEMLSYAHELSHSNPQQATAAVRAFDFAFEKFDLANADSDSISDMKEGLKHAVKIQVPKRNIDNTIMCLGDLCAIYIHEREFQKALSVAEDALERLKNGVSLNMEPYGPGNLAIVFQLSYLYLQSGSHDKAVSVWSEVSDWWPKDQHTQQLRIKGGRAVTDVLLGRFILIAKSNFRKNSASLRLQRSGRENFSSNRILLRNHFWQLL